MSFCYGCVVEVEAVICHGARSNRQQVADVAPMLTVLASLLLPENHTAPVIAVFI